MSDPGKGDAFDDWRGDALTPRVVDAPILPREVEGPIPPATVPVEHRQETARQWIAFALLFILFGEVLFAAIASFFIHIDIIKEVMVIVFGPTAALVGSAIGFYFGQKST